MNATIKGREKWRREMVAGRSVPTVCSKFRILVVKLVSLVEG